jgi:hypothetical protein
MRRLSYATGYWFILLLLECGHVRLYVYLYVLPQNRKQETSFSAQAGIASSPYSVIFVPQPLLPIPSEDMTNSDNLSTDQSLKMEHPTSTFLPEPPSEQATVVRSKTNSKIAHDEKHSGYGDIIRDLIIGFADGLTVPFALTAGLSSQVTFSLQFSSSSSD